MRIVGLDPPNEIAWDCPGGFPSWEGTKIRWSLQPSEHGTKIVFRHTGFADDQPEYDFGSISLTWALIVARLKDVVESGGAQPGAVVNLYITAGTSVTTR